MCSRGGREGEGEIEHECGTGGRGAEKRRGAGAGRRAGLHRGVYTVASGVCYGRVSTFPYSAFGCRAEEEKPRKGRKRSSLHCPRCFRR